MSQEQQPIKIVVVIEGGCLRSVWCDQKASVDLIDYDNIQESGDLDADEVFEESVGNLIEVW